MTSPPDVVSNPLSSIPVEALQHNGLLALVSRHTPTNLASLASLPARQNTLIAGVSRAICYTQTFLH